MEVAVSDANEKLDAILGKGKWKLAENILVVEGKVSDEQRRKMEVFLTYTGQSIQLVEEQALEVSSEQPGTPDMGNAIRNGLQMMLSQRAKGIRTYGQPIEDAGLSADALCEHAQQEMADGLVYVSQLREAIQHEITDAVDSFAAQLFEIVDNESKSQEMRLAIIRDMLLVCNTKRCITMYVQQSQLEEFNRTEGNLLQLSRVQDAFVFKIPLKVTL
jgi:hypothetical protein